MTEQADPNPVLSAKIRADRDRLHAPAPTDEGEDIAAQEAASAARRLTALLREAGEPTPTVHAVPRSPVGPFAVAWVAGLPIVQRASAGLFLFEYTGKELRAHAIPSIAALSTRDVGLYVNPQDYDLLDPDDYESRILPLSEVEAARQDADRRADQLRDDRAARLAHTARLADALTPFQLELANKPMFGEVTYLEWLAAQPDCAGPQAWECALNTIRAIRPA